MRSTLLIERSLGQLLPTQSSSHICRSCRLRGAGFQQRRQIQSSTQYRAGITDLFRRSKGENEGVAAQQEGQVVEVSDGLPETPDKDPNYIEATTWDNLERVGSKSWVEDQRDQQPTYEGWAQVVKNRKLEKPEAEDILLGITKSVTEIPNKDGREWLNYRITDPAIKFKIAKELQKQKGIRISDYALHTATSLRDIRRLLLATPEPKKLAQKLREEEEIKELANVKLHSRRVTPIDKEKAVGRWKIIEQELIDRGLPVTGHGDRAKRV